MNAANVVTSMSYNQTPFQMRHTILLLVATAAVFSSCTTMYKSGQTPDDVYYSPGREVPAYVETNNQTEQNDAYSDGYLRMKSYDRNRWSTFDNDYMYWNDWRWNNQIYYNGFRTYPSYRYGMGWNNGIHPGISYGLPYYGYYSPFTPGYYGSPVIVVNPRTVNPKAYAPRSGNLNTYNRTSGSYSTDLKTGNRTYNISSPTTSPSRTTRSSGYYDNSSGRTRYETGTSNPSRSFDRTNNNSGTRSNNSGNNSSGTRSGNTNSGSAPVRTFPKGGGR